LGLYRSENKLWGIRIRRQAQLEDEEEVVVKKEDDNADDRDLDLPSIDDIINGRSWPFIVTTMDRQYPACRKTFITHRSLTQHLPRRQGSCS
jgi:hypothetical protein